MKHLTKAQIAEIDHVSAKCASAAEKLNGAIDAYNQALADQIEAVTEARDAYNDELAGMREIIEGLHADAESYQSERSEKWQTGDAGRQYADWVDSMEGISELDDIDLDIPTALEQPDLPDWDDKTFLPAPSPEEM